MHTTITKDSFLNNRGKRILIVIFAFFLLYAVAFMLDPYSPEWKVFFRRSWKEMLGEWGTSFVLCLLISESSIAISNQLNKYIRWTDSPVKRLAVETSLNIVAVLAINVLVSLYCHYSTAHSSNAVLSPDETRSMMQWVLISVLISFMIMAIHVGNYLILNWKNEAIRAAELNQVAMDAELQSLKLQIDPHFVFNNLSVLSELILEDQKMGYNYAENFSKIYRYMLINSKKDTITLEEELSFLDSYMFLIQQRFGEAVLFTIQVGDDHRSLSMPPLTLQILVENALKHNKANKKHPLTISISSNDTNELVVENNLQPMEQCVNSSGIGIKNIVRRYHLLSQNVPDIYKDQHIFKVVIPLIKQ